MADDTKNTTETTVDQLEKKLRARYWVPTNCRDANDPHVWVVRGLPESNIYEVLVGTPREVAAYWLKQYGQLGHSPDASADLINHVARSQNDGVKILKNLNWLPN